RHTSDEVFYVEDTPSLPPLPEDNSTTRPAQPLRATGRSSFVARQNVGENGRFAMERETEAMAGIENLLPKPITDILPYYDYAPNGEDPCEYMCPRPAGCPEEDSALPCPEFV